MPAWFLLLNEQKYVKPLKGTKGVGLTPAFLVGATRTPPGARTDSETSRADLEVLLVSMRDDSSHRPVRIMECPDIGQPLATLTAGGNFYLGDPVTHPDGSPSQLYALPDYFEGGSCDIESLVAGLWTILGSFIFEGRFSFRDGVYEPFNADDFDFIQRVLKTDEES